MIRYLQRMRNRKGFTMVELIVVIAIIAVLMAMVLPMFSSDDAEKQAAETYASDFYASLQYNMTRYQLTEYHLTPELQTYTTEYLAGDNDKKPYIMFDEKYGGNAFNNHYVWMEIYYDKEIQYVKVGYNLGEVLSDTSTTSDHPFEKLLQKDLQDTMNSAAKGYYYAVVKCDYEYNATGTALSLDANGYPQGGQGNLVVMSAHYCDEKLPEVSGNYKADNLIFTDFSELKCGIICGTCSSDNCTPYGATTYVGSIGSYFLNVKDLSANSVVVAD